MEASEEARANTLIATLSATDLDSGVNGKVSYRLLNSPPLSFNIHPDNGKITDSQSSRFPQQSDGLLSAPFFLVSVTQGLKRVCGLSRAFNKCADSPQCVCFKKEPKETQWYIYINDMNHYI